MPTRDGRLTHDIDPHERGPQDACGVFGVWAPGEEVAKLTYFGLYALQHRGQESAGIAVGDGHQVLVVKDMGLVPQVFDETTLASLQGHVAIGHCRYSTTGASVWANAQPTYRSNGAAEVALAHNGNLVNTGELAARARATLAESVLFPGLADDCTSDTGVMTELLTARPDVPVETAAMDLLPQLRGAFSLVFMQADTVYAARDPQGLRPLCLGRLGEGWVVASETCALDIVGAEYVRDVEPGELVAVDGDGLRSRRFSPARPKGCVFEYVYLARPDSMIAGRSVHASRVEIGRRLAREAPADADLVIPTPESGTPAAIGFAEQSGIPYGQGLTKNSYVGRTFIQPSQTLRQLGIRMKLNPLRQAIAGKRLVVVDDTIVRGNTQRAIVRMLRDAGAREVHLRIASPPVRWPCFYGIDFASRAELIGAGLDVEEIRRVLDADSLAYVSLAGMVEATTIPGDRLCTACFDGAYPVPLPDSGAVGKHLLENGARPLPGGRRAEPASADR